MYAAERRQWILDQVRADGRVEVAALAADLDVTPETIRRDLSVLEGAGLLRRAHGGAIPAERLRFEQELASRDILLSEEKEAIAQRALSFVPAGGSVLIDAGTTTARFARALAPQEELTVVTNSMPIALELAGRENCQVYCIGGRIRSKTMAAVDAWAVRSLAEVNVDVAFVGTNGITLSRGLSTADQAEAAVKRAMIASAGLVVVLADRSKWGEQKFASFASLEEVDAIVTDAGAPLGLVAEVESAGPKVVLA
ncbi:MAG: DeoR/GlpR family DNA-binding transcription regulator [Actinomycetota bacterium]|nr:DeoR/GlpR family DNA-binding transcription regulator [Actinomycetota bacterium]